MNDRRSTLHLHWRTGLGLSPLELTEWSRSSHGAQVDRLFAESAACAPITTTHTATSAEAYRAMKAPEQFRYRQASREAIQRLNAQWCERLKKTEGVLREKMALFWHGHFACWSHWSTSTEQYLNILRTHALGDFGSLLKAVSRSAAMLEFLNNQRNRKEAPNENFAREVMELFTVGHGRYSERDIHEAARAFTGWAFRFEDGSFRSVPAHHDDGIKEFRGERGNFDGDDILDRLLADEATAHHVAGRIFQWFVRAEPDTAFIDAMGRRFFASGYDIADLMRFVLTSDVFRDRGTHGQRIKPPAELLLGAEKLFDVRYELPEQGIWLQRTLGQELLHPPSVAGWPIGRAWIDSGSLMQRLRLPSVLLTSGELAWEDPAEPSGDAEHMADAATADMPMRDDRRRLLRTRCDPESFLRQLGSDPSTERMMESLLVVDPSPGMIDAIGSGAPADRLVLILSTPEYQLC